MQKLEPFTPLKKQELKNIPLVDMNNTNHPLNEDLISKKEKKPLC